MAGPPSTREHLLARVRLLRRGLSRIVGVGAVVVFALSLLVLVGGASFVGERAPMIGFAVSQALVLAALVVRYAALARLTEVKVGKDGVELSRNGRSKTVPRADIVAGFTLPRSWRHSIELTLKNGDLLTFDVDDEEEGNTVLLAAGLSATQATCRIRVGSIRSWILPAVVLAALVSTTSVALLGMLWIVLARNIPEVLLPVWFWATVIAYVLSLQAAGPPTVMVGADGVAIERGRRQTFISYDRIGAVEIRFGALKLCLLDETVVCISGMDLDPRRLEALRSRIEQARAARAEEPGDSPVAFLERQGKSADGWRRFLVDLMRGGAAYRRVAVVPEEVDRVLQNPSASVEHRIGAAMALSALHGDEAKVRILAAADACASRAVRIALEKAAADELDDAALEEAIGDGASEAARAVT